MGECCYEPGPIVYPPWPPPPRCERCKDNLVPSYYEVVIPATITPGDCTLIPTADYINLRRCNAFESLWGAHLPGTYILGDMNAPATCRGTDYRDDTMATIGVEVYNLLSIVTEEYDQFRTFVSLDLFEDPVSYPNELEYQLRIRGNFIGKISVDPVGGYNPWGYQDGDDISFYQDVVYKKYLPHVIDPDTGLSVGAICPDSVTLDLFYQPAAWLSGFPATLTIEKYTP